MAATTRARAARSRVEAEASTPSNIVRLDTPGLAAPAPRPEPKRDRGGRYLIPDPVTGEERAWTRATTWAKTVANTFGLHSWEKRMVALGLAQRQDLVLRVAAVTDPESKQGKQQLNKLIDQAREHALAGASANLGTALHAFAEAHDLGRPLPPIPAPFDRDLAAYTEAMKSVEMSKNFVEKICTLPELGVAGTMDRVARFRHGPPLIADIKTGRDLSYAWQEISIQLALYAHAATVYDPLTGTHARMLPVNQERALVIHLPAGQGRCTLHLVDIAAGWEMAQVCGRVREWHNRKDLAQAMVDA